MNNSSEFYKSLKRARPALLLVAAMLSMAACAATSTTNTSSSPQAQLMFVQSAEDAAANAAKAIDGNMDGHERSSFIAVAAASAVMLKCLKRSAAGAEAPKLVMPMNLL